jgi:hypothetical protein
MHTSPQNINNIAATIYNLDDLTIDGNRKYRDNLNNLLLEQKEVLDSYKRDLINIRTIIAQNQDDISYLGLEHDNKTLERMHEEKQAQLKVIQYIMESRGIKEYQEKADDALLLLYGPGPYLFFKDDPSLKGITLLSLDKTETGNSIEDFSKTRLELIDLCRGKGIKFEVFKNWEDFYKNFLNSNKIPDETEITNIVKMFSDTEAMALAQKGIELQIEFLLESANRDKYMADKIIASKKGILAIVGRQHKKGIENHLK